MTLVSWLLFTYSCSVVFNSLWPPWTATHQASLSFTSSWNLLKLTSIELVMPSNHLILCCPLLLLPSIFPSIGVFSNESALWSRWPYWSFSINPSNEYSGMKISFGIDCSPNPLQSKGFSRVFSNTTVQKYQFFSTQPSLWSTSHIHTWLLEKPSVSQFSSVTQSCLTLRPHESQHARPPCPSLTPGVYSNPCPSSWWCHSTISSSVVPFSSCPQSIPASGSFPMSQLVAWGGQSWVSASASVLPMNTHDWSPWGWTSWISLGGKPQFWLYGPLSAKWCLCFLIH